MKSSEGEMVELAQTISTAAARGQVEKWLLELEEIMVESVWKVCGIGLQTYPEQPRGEWVRNYPGQAVLAVTQKYWTDEVTNSIVKGRGRQNAGYPSMTILGPANSVSKFFSFQSKSQSESQIFHRFLKNPRKSLGIIFLNFLVKVIIYFR